LAVESRAIDAFWESRTQNKLRAKPETIGQTLFAVFARGALGNNGLLIRELLSGVGFVDFAIILSKVQHLIEVKILTRDFKGVSQLAHYMKNERRRNGWLLVLDARMPSQRKVAIQSKLLLPEGLIRVFPIDINPIAPSRAPAAH